MNTVIKKVFALLLTALLLCAAFGCGKGDQESSTEASAEKTEEMTKTEAETEEITTEEEKTSEATEEPTPEETSTEETTEDPESAFIELLRSYYNPLFISTADNDLNVRSEGSLSGEILGRLPQYTFGTVLKDEGDWMQVKAGDLEGFVAKEFTVVANEAYELAMSLLKKEDGTYTDPFGAANPVEPESAAPEPTQAPTEAPTEGSSQAPTPSGGANGITVCIDAGHQQHGISEMEPNGPGSTVMKAKLTTGTAGCVTGVAEYVVNLDVSLKLQAELEARGYKVVMIRTNHDCPLSNAERAQVANASGAQAFIRIHCNSSTDQSVVGAVNYAPSAGNPYLSADLINQSNTLAATVLDGLCEATGARKIMVLQDDTMTGINWCQIPVTIVEMGFMSNPDEDRLLNDPGYQAKLAYGMANGIDRYFGR